MKATKTPKPDLELTIDSATLDTIRQADGNWTHVANLRYQKGHRLHDDHLMEARFMRRPISILFTAGRQRWSTEAYVTTYVTVLTDECTHVTIGLAGQIEPRARVWRRR